MSWLTQRDPKSSANYRYVEYTGGRILQARELNDVENSEASRRRAILASIFREGAILNLSAAIQGNGVALSKRAPLEPLSIVINASCEPIDEAVVALPPVKPSGADILYAHWVLWRVTADGLHNGTPGCLVDESLIDAATNEKVSERGQLQVILSFDAALSSEAIDPVRMISKSTAPLSVLRIVWTDSVPSIAYYDSFAAQLQATPNTAGMVKLSTGTSDTAVADDDPRLSAGTGPVNTSDVSQPEATGGTTSIQTPEVKTGASDGGIDSARLWYGPLKAKVSDVLAYLAARLAALATSVDDHTSRISALEGRPAGSNGSLDNHIGKPLGKAADGSFTHKPVVTDPSGGYQMIGPSNVPGLLLNSAMAYGVWTTQGVLLGGVDHCGNFRLVNPQLVGGIQSACTGVDLTNYYTLALQVAYLKASVELLAQRL